MFSLPHCRGPAHDVFYTSRIELECAVAAGIAAKRSKELEGHGRGVLFPAGGRYMGALNSRLAGYLHRLLSQPTASGAEQPRKQLLIVVDHSYSLTWEMLLSMLRAHREQLYSAYISILVLRNLLNSSLPVEVVYNGPGKCTSMPTGA